MAIVEDPRTALLIINQLKRENFELKDPKVIYSMLLAYAELGNLDLVLDLYKTSLPYFNRAVYPRFIDALFKCGGILFPHRF